MSKETETRSIWKILPIFIKPEEADLKTNIIFKIIKRTTFSLRGHTGSNMPIKKIFIIYKRKSFHNLFYQNNPF
jgi:type IV secretory pathway VirB9-like protein